MSSSVLVASTLDRYTNLTKFKSLAMFLIVWSRHSKTSKTSCSFWKREWRIIVRETPFRSRTALSLTTPMNTYGCLRVAMTWLTTCSVRCIRLSIGPSLRYKISSNDSWLLLFNLNWKRKRRKYLNKSSNLRSIWPISHLTWNCFDCRENTMSLPSKCPKHWSCERRHRNWKKQRVRSWIKVVSWSERMICRLLSSKRCFLPCVGVWSKTVSKST